jgi:SAM-dependent methyltransferase
MGGPMVDQTHESEGERARTADLMRLTPTGYGSVLDAGARDGYYSRLLSGRFVAVTALDVNPLNPGRLNGIRCVQGDLTQLPFTDNSFDVVFCSEVLEHIPGVDKACSEIVRVTRNEAVIAVPYRQDTRVGRTTCGSCGRANPPWGHVNSFDEERLAQLFHPLRAVRWSYVWTNQEHTNAVASWLMDRGGNPWGAYNSQEPCGHCGAKLYPPAARSALQRLCGTAAFALNLIQGWFTKPHANWIHLVFQKERRA